MSEQYAIGTKVFVSRYEGIIVGIHDTATHTMLKTEVAPEDIGKQIKVSMRNPIYEVEITRMLKPDEYKAVMTSRTGFSVPTRRKTVRVFADEFR